MIVRALILLLALSGCDVPVDRVLEPESVACPDGSVAIVWACQDERTAECTSRNETPVAGCYAGKVFCVLNCEVKP